MIIYNLNFIRIMSNKLKNNTILIIYANTVLTFQGPL